MARLLGRRDRETEAALREANAVFARRYGPVPAEDRLLAAVIGVLAAASAILYMAR